MKLKEAGSTTMRSAAGAAALVFAMVAVLGLALTVVLGLVPDISPATAAGPYPQEAQSEETNVTDDRIASFAVRAVAEAALIDPLGRFYDYLSTSRSGNEWFVDFDVASCYRTRQVETCNPGGSASVTVGERDGSLVVIDAQGPMTSGQREELLAYSEAATEEGPELQFPVVRISEPLPSRPDASEYLEVRASGLWTGDLSLASPQDCTLEVLDESGTVVFSKAIPGAIPPTKDSDRAGTMLGMGIPAGEFEASSARISCE